MIDLEHIKNIYIAHGYTDMREQADGLLSLLQVNCPEINLTTHNLYLFCGRSRVVIKVLEIDDTGVWVYYKRTHGDKFLWPKQMDNQIIDKRQLLWLLDGLDIIQRNAHKTKKYSY